MPKLYVCLAAICLLALRPVAGRAQGTPANPASAPAPVASPAAPAPPTGTEILGRSYSVELKSGNTFLGVLRAAGIEELEFETKDLGLVRVKRADLKTLLLLTPEQARHGYDDVGNGNRLFFAPTARNLRKGEGYVQNLELFFLSANYGISDNFSMGALVTLIPGQGSDNLFGLTPKFSAPVSEKFRVGAGALLIGTRSGTGGVGYANSTYGTADNNVTLGVGYGFSGQGGFINTPIVVVGGAVRVSRRISLMNETYLARDYIGGYRVTVGVGIIGVRVAGPRIGGGLGMLYFYGEASDSSGSLGSGNQQAPFAELTVRFGKIAH